MDSYELRKSKDATIVQYDSIIKNLFAKAKSNPKKVIQNIQNRLKNEHDFHNEETKFTDLKEVEKTDVQMN